MSKYLEAEKRLAELLGFTQIRLAHADDTSLVGVYPNREAMRLLPRWTRDNAAWNRRTEPAGSAKLGTLTNEGTKSTHQQDVSIKAWEIDLSDALTDLVDCTSMLMEWCVKNVDKWSFPQYDWTDRAVKKARALLAAKGK